MGGDHQQVLRKRRDDLVGRIRQLQREIDAAQESVIRSPDFDPRGGLSAAETRIGFLTRGQDEVIEQISEIDRLLRASP
jgi:hypothetical protein